MSFIDNSGGSITTKDDIIRALQEQVTQQNVTALINRMQKRCFEKCVPNPGSSLSSSESKCLSDCGQKYLHLLDVASKRWNQSMDEMRNRGSSL